jgi:predicted flap endonuclease-1-like 5' DNA nuclease
MDHTTSATQDNVASSEFPQAQWPVDPLALMNFGKPAETPMEAWLSLFPTSPLFGVRWALWDIMTGASTVGEVQSSSAPSGGVRPSAKREADALSMPELRVPPKAANAVKNAPQAEAKARVALKPSAKKVATKKDKNDASPANLFSAPPTRIDDLKAIKGVGPRLEIRLNELGIYQYEQIASFDESDFAWLDTKVAALFRGRGIRDDWAGQATALIDKPR